MRNTAHVHALIGMVYGKRSRNPEALDELAEAEKLNPGFDMTYVYRGNVYESSGNRPQAAREYQRALAANPLNQAARDALARVSP
jgi:tetratricopeptide (TPR) repeat protein